ncbi:HAD-IB family phosphatase [Bryobacter aggregatus]|uniref:HAD-IB family phosphatase n=1 Tax=Bryobacter aggregatus TaxID=360054 RepID=UPI0004E1794D|nr:HAD-IB family phosphatase [Bryobacter aggregatus]
MAEERRIQKQYLLASDFDHTLSFNDSGVILSEMLGIDGFQAKIAEISRKNFIQQGGELSYLLLHDPEYRQVRSHHLIAVGKKIRLKANIRLVSQLLNSLDGYRFGFYVISAAPEEVIQSALEGIVPPENIYGTRLNYNEAGEVCGIERVCAGYGKVTVLDELQSSMKLGRDQVVYMGDGSSDIHVMLHVNRYDGLTIAVSEAKHISQIAKRTVLSDDSLSVLVPILEEILGWQSSRIRALFEAHGFTVQEWDKVKTDWLTIEPMDARETAELQVTQ